MISSVYSNLLLRRNKKCPLLMSIVQHKYSSVQNPTHFDSRESLTKNIPLPELNINEVKKKVGLLMGVEKGFHQTPLKRDHLLSMLPQSQEEMPIQSMKDGYSFALLPLKSEESLQDKYANILGCVRVGRLLEDMDMFAVWVALKYIKNPKQEKNMPTPYVIVTALVDNISILGECKVTGDIKFHGLVTWVGNSSIEICVWLEQLDSDGWKQFIKAYFIMAVRNSTNTGKAFVNKLEPKGEQEIKKYEKAQKRMLKRRNEKEVSLLKRLPDMEEQKLIHELFTKSVDKNDPSLSKRILPPQTAWMNNTKLTTVLFPHPEDKNHHNTVFGGLIMRLAVELGWMVGYNHSKQRPSLKNVSDITFRRPIAVGEFLQMSGQIVYTEGNFMHVVVQVELHDIKTGIKTITNTFNFTYETPTRVIEVIPLTYHGGMKMIDGRRSFKQFLNRSDIHF